MTPQDPIPPDPWSDFATTLSLARRAEVLLRDGSTCQACGGAAGETDGLGRRTRLDVKRVVPRERGGDDSLDNLKAMCTACSEAGRTFAGQPPTWIWLLSQVRRARPADQRKALEWLQAKFPGETPG